MITKSYPLQWPSDWKKVENPIHSRFGDYWNKPSILKSTNKLIEEMRLFKGTDLIISSDMKLKNNGLPYSNQNKLKNKGVAIYFMYESEQRVIACDSFDKIGCNLWAISKTIEALRGIDRWGCSEILNKAFTGFTALPQHASKSNFKQWWEVMGYNDPLQVSSYGAFGIKNIYRELSKKYHPDNLLTGDKNKFQEIKEAYEKGIKFLKNK